MEAILYQRITVYGRVQGVGFRPALCRIGVELGLKGYVRNAGSFVAIVVAGEKTTLELMVQRVYALPEPALVERVEVEQLTGEQFTALYTEVQQGSTETFFAVASLDKRDKSFVPSDLAICPSCIQELKTKANRRYGYPYISCAQCGPRYTIMRRLPYDRANTTMDRFAMCPECQKEYMSFGNSRQHAETISCHACGPQLFAYVRDSEVALQSTETLEQAKQLLLAGKIIMVKSVGGFNLVCLATKAQAVAQLRLLKQRPTKPFALMCGTVAEVEALCEVSVKEKEVLQAAIRPIVLLKPRPTAKQNIAAGVAEECAALGVMLPAMGFYQQLCELGLPLIVTSANYSGAPIIYKDEDALAFYRAKQEVAGLFTYERDILRPADDSVVRVLRLGEDKEVVQVLRRTRGYMPEPLALRGSSIGEPVLAVGAEMEPSFTLASKGKAYLAQLPCRLEEERSETEFMEREQDWEQLLALKPSLIVADLHPSYSSTVLGKRLAEEKAISFAQMQHHQAHALSVMAEHGLAGPCLAVCFDGTGYGADGTVWGGEFLLCQGAEYKRVAHLEPVTMLGGDASMKQAWKSAMCYAASLAVADTSDMAAKVELQGLLSQDSRYSIVKAALANKINVIQNSSMGRLFDAASYLLGLAEENTHQGRCAMALEARARLALDKGLEPLEMHLVEALRGSRKDVETKGYSWSARELWHVLAKARTLGDEAVTRAALGFHKAVIELVVRVAQKQQVKQVVLCGGCFANRILLEGCHKELTSLGFEVYFNKQVAPGDGGLALGQAYYGLLVQKNN